MEQITRGLLSWASILADNTREQAIKTATMPFIKPHVALMPDAHLGKGATVGSVIPTEKAIIPAAVGVDIGCNMIATRTQFVAGELYERGSLAPLREAIERAVPLSAGNYNTEITDTAAERIKELYQDAHKIELKPESYAANWEYHLGTLGSGNHFIEIVADELDRVWIFLHSGSRGIGNRIAQKHIKVARDLMEKYYISLPDPDLAYLVEGTDEFWNYIRELFWAQKFAKHNTAEMADRVEQCLGAFMDEEVEQMEVVHCHHNYTAREKHYGMDLWVSRKGAINAHEGVRGLIPGSMGTASYIVTGKGFPPSLCSAPHGAGREYSRTAACKKYTLEDLKKSMEGIEYKESEEFIDEIPGAYKDVEVVMEDASDLVTVDHKLRQLVNVKGD